MIYQLTTEQKAHVQAKVKDVLDGRIDRWSAEQEHYPLMALVSAITDIDGVEEGERDTNGWAWDYWQYFTFNNKQFTLSGSGYHGGQSFHEREMP